MRDPNTGGSILADGRERRLLLCSLASDGIGRYRKIFRLVETAKNREGINTYGANNNLSLIHICCNSFSLSYFMQSISINIVDKPAPVAIIERIQENQYTVKIILDFSKETPT